MRAVGWLILIVLALAVLVMGFIVLMSFSPVAVIILLGLLAVVGVPVVAGVVLLVVIAEAGDDGWSRPGQYFDWSTAPKIRDRWPRDKL